MPENDTAQGAFEYLKGDERSSSRELHLQGLLGKALDTMTLGHPISAADWQEMCLLGGRYCAPFLNIGRERTSADN